MNISSGLDENSVHEMPTKFYRSILISVNICILKDMLYLRTYVNEFLAVFSTSVGRFG